MLRPKRSIVFSNENRVEAVKPVYLGDTVLHGVGNNVPHLVHQRQMAVDGLQKLLLEFITL